MTKRQTKQQPKIGDMFNMGFAGLIEIISIDNGYMTLKDPKIPAIPTKNLVRVKSSDYIKGGFIQSFRDARAKTVGDVEYFWDFNERDVD